MRDALGVDMIEEGEACVEYPSDRSRHAKEKGRWRHSAATPSTIPTTWPIESQYSYLHITFTYIFSYSCYYLRYSERTSRVLLGTFSVIVSHIDTNPPIEGKAEVEELNT